MKETPDASERAPHVIKVRSLKELPGRLALDDRLTQPWGAQCQEFLKALATGWGNPRLAKCPWDDAKAFLDSFEQVAEACQWHRGEWVARLLPALSGETERAYSQLEVRDREDYGKVKAAILQGEANRMETRRQHFRQFRYQDVEDPQRIYGQLRELCHQWLKPERHTKEQILELLILEQFLAILPQDLQNRIRSWDLERGTQTMAEQFVMSPQEAKAWEWQVPLEGVTMDPLAAEGGLPRPIYPEAQEKADGDLCLLASGIISPRQSSSALPSEDQAVAAATAAVTEMPATLNEVTVSLANADWAVANPNQATMHWEVMQETPADIRALGGFVIPKPEVVSHVEQREMIFVQDSEDSEAFPGSLSAEEPTEIKNENSLHGSSEPEEIYSMSLEISQGKASLVAEIHERGCDADRHRGKMRAEEWVEGAEVAEGHTAVKGTARHTRTSKSSLCKGGKLYRSKSGLATNQALYARATPYECLVCGKCFQKKNYLAKHQRIHTKPKVYRCPECRESFNWREEFVRHRGTHTGERPHECSECGKCFSQRESLIRHEKIHTGKKPYECTECGKNFCRRDSLVRHLKIHTGEKPYECPDCGKSFNQREVLIRHRRIHTGEKPYECLECGESFSQRAILNRHEKIHSGEKTLLLL